MFDKETVEHTHKETMRFLVRIDEYQRGLKSGFYSGNDNKRKRLAAYRAAMDLREALLLLCKRDEVVN